MATTLPLEGSPLSVGNLIAAYNAANVGQPHGLSRFYKGGGLVPTDTTLYTFNVPTSGAVAMSALQPGWVDGAAGPSYDFRKATNISGTTVLDSSGSNRTLTFTNAPPFSGNGVPLTSTYVGTTVTTIPLTGGFTVELLVKMTTLPSSFPRLFVYGITSGSSTTGTAWNIQVTAASPTRFYAYLNTQNPADGTRALRYNYCSTTISTGTWYHAVFTFGGTIGKWYLNGAQTETDPIGGNAGWPIASDAERTLVVSSSSGVNPPNGEIAIARVFQRVLSDTEVSLLYGVAKGGGNPYALP